MGRASDLEGLVSSPNRFPLEPCISTGPFVREDGTVGPCCSGLAYEARGKHPCEFGNSHTDSLTTCRKRWLEDPLLRMLWLVGFSVPLKWLSETDQEYLLQIGTPGNVCELCVALWDENGQIGKYLRERVSQPKMIAQLDRMEALLFAE
jgi:hypothetical protein